MTQKTEGVQLQVTWGKCVSGRWCQLNKVDLSNELFNDVAGVYLIWRGSDAKTVYVGQGDIRNRLARRRDDPRIQAYSESVLYATWASVPAEQMDGVEVYLAEVCEPLVGERWPEATPISVNPPGGD